MNSLPCATTGWAQTPPDEARRSSFFGRVNRPSCFHSSGDGATLATTPGLPPVDSARQYSDPSAKTADPLSNFHVETGSGPSGLSAFRKGRQTHPPRSLCPYTYSPTRITPPWWFEIALLAYTFAALVPSPSGVSFSRAHPAPYPDV